MNHQRPLGRSTAGSLHRATTAAGAIAVSGFG